MHLPCRVLGTNSDGLTSKNPLYVQYGRRLVPIVTLIPLVNLVIYMICSNKALGNKQLNIPRIVSAAGINKAATKHE